MLESSQDVECKLKGVLLVTIDPPVGTRIGETQGMNTDSSEELISWSAFFSFTRSHTM